MLSMVRSLSSNVVVEGLKWPRMPKGPYVSNSVVTLHDPNNMNNLPSSMVLEPWSWSAAGVLYRCGEIVAYGPSAIPL